MNHSCECFAGLNGVLDNWYCLIMSSWSQVAQVLSDWLKQVVQQITGTTQYRIEQPQVLHILSKDNQLDCINPASIMMALVRIHCSCFLPSQPINPHHAREAWVYVQQYFSIINYKYKWLQNTITIYQDSF